MPYPYGPLLPSTAASLRASVALALFLPACTPRAGFGQDRLTADWPQWQRIETSELPEDWRLLQATVAFDAWEASGVVARLSTADGATAIRFDGGGGEILDVRLAALPSQELELALGEGDSVRFALTRRQGFEGVARGLAVREPDGALLLLYDDGGYGPVYNSDGARGGVGINRSLSGTGSGDDWASRDVTFRLAGDSVVCAEGETRRLGDSGLGVRVVVSREWTGDPVTDVDLSPLAYLIFRVR